MQKQKKTMGDKEWQAKNGKKEEKRIKFNLDRSYLECFISAKSCQRMKEKKTDHQNPTEKKPKIYLKEENQARNRSFLSSKIFNQTLLMMQYDQDELYIDSTRNKHKLRSPSPKSQESIGQSDIVTSCVKAITEETENSLSKSYGSQQLIYMNLPRRQGGKNRRTVSNEESSLYCISLENIERDGRTTIMLRNIPNKYTRDMIMEEIDAFNFRKKYDFFYLPIDYRNDCNVGYAFINFIHAKFIPQFYEHFHMKKWQKFNSEKICQLCYARIQGTVQLLHHFKDSTVIQQKDKKLRPMIDINYSNVATVVERQKNEKIGE